MGHMTEATTLDASGTLVVSMQNLPYLGETDIIS